MQMIWESSVSPWLKMNLWGPNSSWFWTMAQFFAVAASLLFIYRQVAAQAQSNMLQTLGTLSSRWESEEMKKFRKVVSERYGQNMLQIGMAEGGVLGFFEDIGIFLKRRALDAEIVWDNYSYYIEHYWPLLEPNVRRYREQTNSITWFINCERLYGQMLRYSRKKRIKVKPKTEAEMKKFVRGETETLPKDA